MIRVDVNVNDVDGLIEGFGAGAILWLERAPTETGTYVQVASQALASGIDFYTFWDPSGDDTSWYRTYVSDSTNTSQTDRDEPFQAGSVLAYAELADLIELLPKVALDVPRNLNAMTDALVRATDVINARVQLAGGGLKDFFRHPQVSGTEVRTFDLRENTQRLVIPSGVISVDSVRFRYTEGGDWQTIAPGSWRLRPLDKGADEPYWYLDLPSAPTFYSLYVGPDAAEVTGAFGFPRIPGVMRAGCLALAREIVATILTPGGVPRGDWSNPNTPLPTETYTAVQWGAAVGPPTRWFA